MKVNFEKCNIEQLWKYVASHLRKNSIETCLVGNSVASIYTSGEIYSDIIEMHFLTSNLKKIDKVMNQIGFRKDDEKMYQHELCQKFKILFHEGVLAIGEDSEIKARDVRHEGVTIKMLSPTDSVKDRLANLLYFQDSNSLNQAMIIHGKQKIDMASLKNWCADENAMAIFERYLAALKK